MQRSSYSIINNVSRKKSCESSQKLERIWPCFGLLKMSFIECYLVNDQVYCYCTPDGMPESPFKKERRKLRGSEIQLENQYLKKIERSNFDQNNSNANLWISKIFGVPKPNRGLINSVAMFFAILSNQILPREVYRRRKCCLYWINNNFAKFNEECKKKKIAAKDKFGKIYYFHTNSELTKTETKEKKKVDNDVFRSIDQTDTIFNRYMEFDDMTANDIFDFF